MNLKKGLIATSVVLALLVPATAFAATSASTTAVKIRGLFGIDSSKLTETQLKDVTDYATQVAALQKSLIDKMVASGAMTQAQADAQKAEIDARLASGDIEIGGGRGFKGSNDGIKGGIDTSKLTDAQKSTLITLKTQKLSLYNDLAKTLVSQGLITQAQADAVAAKVTAAITALTATTTTDTASGHDTMKSGLGSMNLLQGLTLTDAQKTAVLDWAAKYAAVEKQIVALYKDAGLITEAQATAMNTQIDARAADPLNSTLTGDDRMGGGKHGGHEGKGDKGNTDNSGGTTTQSSTTKASSSATPST